MCTEQSGKVVENARKRKNKQSGLAASHNLEEYFNSGPCSIS
jgi:hypothetical protein